MAKNLADAAYQLREARFAFAVWPWGLQLPPPTPIAIPDVRKSGGAIDEYRERLIVLHNVLRDGRRRHRPERDFAEKGAVGMVMRFRASILPPRSLDVNQLKQLAVRIFNVQRK